MSSRVEDVMTRNVATVEETAGYKDIIAVMRRRRVSAVPVVDADKHLVGVVSEADLLLKEIGEDALGGYLISTGRRGERAKATGVSAAELMSTPVVTIGPDDTVANAARLMHDERVKRLPVVDSSGRLAGIISRIDVLSVFTRPDDQIREAVRTVVEKDFGLDPGAFEVTVRSGIVTVAGHAGSRSVPAELSEALRHLEGVVAVRDRIRYPPGNAAVPPPRPAGQQRA